MRQISDKQSAADPNNPTADEQYTAQEFNQGIKDEVQRFIPATGQAFNPVDETQLQKAVAEYSATGGLTDAVTTFPAGTSTLYSLSEPAGGRQIPPRYIDGMVLTFSPEMDSIQAVNVNLNGLGEKDVVFNGFDFLDDGTIGAEQDTQIIFDQDNDRFRTVNPFFGRVQAIELMAGSNENTLNGAGIKSAIQASGNLGRTSSITSLRYSNDSVGPFITAMKSRGTSPNDISPAQVGDIAGSFAFSFDELVLGVPARANKCFMRANVESVIGTGIIADLQFNTGGNNESLRIRGNGDLVGTRAGGTNLGEALTPWNNLYVQNAPIVTSDQTLKTEIRTLSQKEIDAFYDVSIVMYKLSSAVQLKGDSARIHSGVIAQQVDQIFASHGLSAADYGLYCSDPVYQTKTVTQKECVRVIKGPDGKLKDVCETVTREEFVLDVNGEKIIAGHTLKIRYEELLVGICEAMKHKITNINSRLQALEANVS